mmetsp:Transcript_18776/g.27133  ORF Transcript_18776/g.27133 Transcript_18776/m.27133 type:complete len:95 (+) Transcript_18776:339-623(+)
MLSSSTPLARCPSARRLAESASCVRMQTALQSVFIGMCDGSRADSISAIAAPMSSYAYGPSPGTSLKGVSNRSIFVVPFFHSSSGGSQTAAAPP